MATKGVPHHQETAPREPVIHSHITDEPPEAHPLAFETVDCRVCKVMVHAMSHPAEALPPTPFTWTIGYSHGRRFYCYNGVLGISTDTAAEGPAHLDTTAGIAHKDPHCPDYIDALASAPAIDGPMHGYTWCPMCGDRAFLPEP